MTGRHIIIRVLVACFALAIAWLRAGPRFDVSEIFYHDLAFCIILALAAGMTTVLHADPRFNAFVFAAAFFLGMNGANLQLEVYYLARGDASTPILSLLRPALIITLLSFAIYAVLFRLNKACVSPVAGP